MKIGQEVYVNRQIGKNGLIVKTKGKIDSFSKTVLVKGKSTAKIRFEDDSSYWFPIDEILLVLSEPPKDLNETKK